MLQSGNDERMLKSFRELRAGDEANAPGFDRVWRTARAAAEPRRTTHGRLAVALAMVAVAAISSALTIVATQSPVSHTTSIAADPPPLTNSSPASASEALTSDDDSPAAPAVAGESVQPTTVSDTPSRKTSKPARSPRRQKPNQSVPCVEC